MTIDGVMKSTSPARRNGPGAFAIGASFLLHVALIAAVIFVRGAPPKTEFDEFKTYRVSIYSPPPQVQGEPEPVIEAPKPAVVEAPKPAVVETPKPKPKPEVKTPPKAESTAEKPTKKQVAGANPKPVAIGGEGLNVNIEGDEFPFPGYLENAVRVINRYFRWTGAGNLEAEVGFYIRSDGSVTGIRIVRGSRSAEFNLAAAEAVEQAGRRKAFGPLPQDFSYDQLGVLFTFLPPNK